MNGVFAFIKNTCTAFGITVQFSTGAATATIPPGAEAMVYGDGTNAQIAFQTANDHGTISRGTTTLSAGVSPAITASLAAGSTIVFSLRTNANDALSVKYAALDADRVLGAQGNFKITALLAGGTINNVDTSTVDWYVVT